VRPGTVEGQRPCRPAYHATLSRSASLPEARPLHGHLHRCAAGTRLPPSAAMFPVYCAAMIALQRPFQRPCNVSRLIEVFIPEVPSPLIHLLKPMATSRSCYSRESWRLCHPTRSLNPCPHADARCTGGKTLCIARLIRLGPHGFADWAHAPPYPEHTYNACLPQPTALESVPLRSALQFPWNPPKNFGTVTKRNLQAADLPLQCTASTCRPKMARHSHST
jgi:hypothetical protein